MASPPAELGGWANIVRKEAVAEPKLDFSGLLRSSAGLKTVVVDANALIGRGVKLYGIADQFVTIQEVLDEVRDPAARFHLATLPVSITCLEPTEEALAIVTKFARATGDLPSLSNVDLKVIALAYTLESQMHGTSFIRSEPPPLLVTRSAAHMRGDLPGWGTVDNAEEWEGIEDEPSSRANSRSRILSLKPLDPGITQSTTATKRSDEEGRKHGDRGSVSEEGERDATNSLVATSLVEGEKDSSSTQSLQESPVQQDRRSTDREEESSGHSERLQPAESKPSSPRKQSPIIEGRANFADEVNGSKGEIEDNGDGWERACCRTTRRNYLKREAKRSAKMLAAQSAASELASCTLVEEVSPIAEHGETAGTLGGDGSSDIDSAFQGVDTDADSKLAEDSAGSNPKNDEADQAKLDKDDIRLWDDAVERSSDGVVSLSDTGFVDDTSSLQSDGLESENSWMMDSLSRSSVACMTGDFAMQNVLIQMGLRLLSTTGLHIRELNKWVLKCEACNHVASDVDRIFCPKCGNGGTLFKVSVTVGQNGRVHAGRPRRINLRGTKYSLPLPKGGREGAEQNPVLREDQLPAKVLHPRPKKTMGLDVRSSDDLMFGVVQGKKGQELSGLKSAASIFGGRRNPNERRRGRS